MRIVVALLLALAIAVFAAGDLFRGAVTQPPGELVDSAPEQTDTALRAFRRGEYNLVPVAGYRLDARILGITHYHFDRESDLAPYDVAVGWRAMSDTALLERLEISQRDRFFFWHADTMPATRDTIEHNAANMHLIPADDAVKAVIADARVGQVIHLEGALVNVTAPDGWRWRSSLSRNDTGAGACELMYVERASLP